MELFISFLILLSGSTNSIKTNYSAQIDSIQVVNRTALTTWFKRITIQDPNSIKKIVGASDTIKIAEAYNRFDNWGNPAAKNSFGSLDVSFYQNGSVVKEIEIYFTIFRGVVLIQNLEYYKNDDFYGAVLDAMQPLLGADKRFR